MSGHLTTIVQQSAAENEQALRAWGACAAWARVRAASAGIVMRMRASLHTYVVAHALHYETQKAHWCLNGASELTRSK